MRTLRNALPQLGERIFMTDGGLETTLLFHQGIDLPCFAAFDLLKDARGTQTLVDYYVRYLDMARAARMGIVLDAPTWRASADWGAKLGYDASALDAVNRRAVAMLVDLRNRYAPAGVQAVVSGVVGPRGDGYRAQSRMSAAQAGEYHARQIEVFAHTDADMVVAYTINYIDEGVGIVEAARTAGIPVAISFTLETDGRLPSGESLERAVRDTDARTDAYPAYYMINCAHPTHFESVLQAGGAWCTRLRGLRANASRRSHAELDECSDLDAGNPVELGGQYRALHRLLPKLSVVGGCCGTDHRHVEQICRAFATSM